MKTSLGPFPSPGSIRRLLVTAATFAVVLIVIGCTKSGATTAETAPTDEATTVAGLVSFEEAATEGERIAAVLGLEPGMRVADVGAGDGEWVEVLAAAVGPMGEVLATEVDEDDVEDLRQLAESNSLDNIRVIEGSATDTGLPADCCDSILLRLVYHHFTDPEPMRASLRRALRPGARLAVIDIEPQEDWRRLEGVPERGGHGIPMADLIAEMSGDGFEVVERFEDWPDDEDHFCVVFRRVDSAATYP